MELTKLLVFVCFISLAISIDKTKKNKKKENAKPMVNLTQATKKSNKNETSSSDYCFNSQFGLDGPLNKLLGFAPMSPNEMGVKFLLFTCKNKDKPQNFTYLSGSRDWKNSNFDTKVMTRFIVHGFLERYPGNAVGVNWMEQIKNLVLKKSCVNVVAIDWSTPARSIYYYQAAANTRVVGRMIGCVINRWKDDLKYNPLEKVHLIGHSLGGQVVGFAGKEVQSPKVKRITGLDPAGPGFQEFDDNNKLAVTDGQCVNVIHTNGARTIPILDGFGHFKPMGHVDFYPNGGHAQPGCTIVDSVGNFLIDAVTNPKKTIEDISDPVLCNHVRSNKYAIADQNYTDAQKCQVIGYRCKSYDDFNLGKCGADCGDDGSGCKFMPLNLDYWDDTKNCDPNGVHIEYYLNTGDVDKAQEYCLYHYQIIVSIKDTITACLGEVNIKLSNGKQIDVKLELKNSLDSKDGNKGFTKLFTDPEELGDFTGADVKTIGLNCVVNKLEFNFMTSLDASIRKSKSKTLCSTDGKAFSDKC